MRWRVKENKEGGDVSTYTPLRAENHKKPKKILSSATTTFTVCRCPFWPKPPGCCHSLPINTTCRTSTEIEKGLHKQCLLHGCSLQETLPRRSVATAFITSIVHFACRNSSPTLHKFCSVPDFEVDCVLLSSQFALVKSLIKCQWLSRFSCISA